MVIWLPDFVEKIQAKHGLTQSEVEEVLLQRPHVRFIERRRTPGEHLYAAYGQSFVGRYLTVFFVLKVDRSALIISARDMDSTEKRRYGRRK